MSGHHYTNSSVDTVAAAVMAGINLEDGPSGIKPVLLAVTDAVQQGKLTETMVRSAVRPMFYTRMRLGLFDPPEVNPYATLDPKIVVQSLEHRQLSLVAAQRSIVLLKNSGALPLSAGKKFSKIAIVGPMANNVEGMFGGYAPEPDPQYVTTPYDSLKSLAQETRLGYGCAKSDPRCMDYNVTEIGQAVNGTDLVFVCLGTGDVIEAEGNDRPNIDLPGKQLQLLLDAVSLSASAPVILILFNAGPLDVTWAQNSPRVVAILEAFFPAQATGEALRAVLLNEGPFANPAGRLPASWPMSIDQYPPITDYTMVNRTYRYLTSNMLYPFGYGLSYTTFHYRSLDIRPSVVKYENVINIDVYVSNEGPYDGEEVIQVYVTWGNKSLPSPNIQLIDFERFFIPVKQGITGHFQVPLERLAVWSDDPPGYVTLKGDYRVYAGGQQPGQKTSAPSNVLVGGFTVV
jgi:beta-glucosidase